MHCVFRGCLLRRPSTSNIHRRRSLEFSFSTVCCLLLGRIQPTTKLFVMSDTPAAPVKKTPKKAKKPKAPAAHPKFAVMVADAIKTLKERKGSSRQAILKYVLANFKVGDNARANSSLKFTLRAGVKNGSLKQSKGTGASGSFRLGDVKNVKKPKAKKVAAKKPKTAKAKKPAAKKPKANKPAAKKAKKPAAKKPAAKKPAKKAAKKPAAKKAKKPAAKKPAAKKAAKK